MNNSTIAQASALSPHLFTTTNENTIINTNTLFKNEDVVFIQHQGKQYCLRRTRNGKLILTK